MVVSQVVPMKIAYTLKKVLHFSPVASPVEAFICSIKFGGNGRGRAVCKGDLGEFFRGTW